MLLTVLMLQETCWKAPGVGMISCVAVVLVAPLCTRPPSLVGALAVFSGSIQITTATVSHFGRQSGPGPRSNFLQVIIFMVGLGLLWATGVDAPRRLE